MNEEAGKKKSGCLFRLIAFVVVIAVANALYTSGWFGTNDTADTTATEQPTAIISMDNALVDQFLTLPYEHAQRNAIPLNTFPEQTELAAWFTEISNVDLLSQAVNVRRSRDVGAAKYSLTQKNTGLYYIGELKDSAPDGYGVVIQYDHSRSYYKGEDAYSYVYIGEFSKGYFSGYGLRFCEETDESPSVLKEYLSSDSASPSFDFYYQQAINYVTYEGEFKKGLFEGNGNFFYTSLYYQWLAREESTDPFADGISYTCKIGEFKDGWLNGKAKIYYDCTLSYDGEMMDNDYWGKGVLYYAMVILLREEFYASKPRGTIDRGRNR